MRPDDLIDKFPLLYKDFDSHEVGEGWGQLLHALAIRLEPLIKDMEGLQVCLVCDHIKSAHDGKGCCFVGTTLDNKYEAYLCSCTSYEEHLPKVVQVKEKYGGLRYYMSGNVTEQMEAYIQSAENMSFTICELCGEPGKPRGGGWITVRCDQHVKS